MVDGGMRRVNYATLVVSCRWVGPASLLPTMDRRGAAAFPYRPVNAPAEASTKLPGFNCTEVVGQSLYSADLFIITTSFLLVAWHRKTSQMKNKKLQVKQVAN